MKPPEKIDLVMIPTPSSAQLADDLLKLMKGDAAADDGRGSPKAHATAEIMDALVSVANQSWRIASAVTDPDSKEAKESLTAQEIKRIAKAVEGLTAIFDGLGLRVIDRMGEPFNAALPDQVVTEEQREGLSREMIVRTIRPTIIWNQTLVQRGEVDIAVPASKK